jgi:hypothetical protein
MLYKSYFHIERGLRRTTKVFHEGSSDGQQPGGSILNMQALEACIYFYLKVWLR